MVRITVFKPQRIQHRLPVNGFLLGIYHGDFRCLRYMDIQTFILQSPGWKGFPNSKIYAAQCMEEEHAIGPDRIPWPLKFRVRIFLKAKIKLSEDTTMIGDAEKIGSNPGSSK